MKSKLPLLMIIVLVLIGLVVFFLYQKEKPFLKIPFISSKKMTVQLYFSSKDGLSLVPEVRQIHRLEDRLHLAKEVINELIKGPTSTNLFPTIPQQTQLHELYLHKDIAYVDFSNELIKNHPGGSSGEIQTIFSIVNTLTANFSEIKYVQFLVEGKEIETIAGHIDTTMPFQQNLSIGKQESGKSEIR
ncbi:GerMN domain-containing protein [Patescibacteria group bacterium]|nr:GerMN domain-containing protein [Patescibacteria group bacterium]